MVKIQRQYVRHYPWKSFASPSKNKRWWKRRAKMWAKWPIYIAPEIIRDAVKYWRLHSKQPFFKKRRTRSMAGK